MNPIAQKTMGLGAMIGFAATFITGSPIVMDAWGLVIRSVAGGVIFGMLGYVIGTLMHRYVSDKVDLDVEAYLLERELIRQKKRQKAADALASMSSGQTAAGGEIETEAPTIEVSPVTGEAEPVEPSAAT